MWRRLVTALVVGALSASAALAADEPNWVEAMRIVHRGFAGQRGYVAQFGDSITYSMAFWTPIGWDEPDQYLTQDDGLPKRPTARRWRDTLQGFRSKGPEHGNYSGWRVGNVLAAMDQVLARERPEVAVIMVGTNDISGGRVPDDYRPGLEKIVQKCVAAHCVPILTTIPPRRGFAKAVADANQIIRDVARDRQTPLIDYHAECLRLQPGEAWDRTIISDDGVHPSGGKANIYTDENMKICGYALRNWLTFRVVREVYFRVLEPK